MDIAAKAPIVLALGGALTFTAIVGFTRRDPVVVRAASPEVVILPQADEPLYRPSWVKETLGQGQPPSTCGAAGDSTVVDSLGDLAVGDRDIASFLAISFPSDLAVDPDRETMAPASLARFHLYLAVRTMLAQQLIARDTSLIERGSPVEAVAASARVALVSASLADALFRAPIPYDLLRGEDAEDKVDAYCDLVTTAAEPLAEQAVASLSRCVESARWYAHDAASDDDVRSVLTAAEPCLDALEVMHPEGGTLEEVFAASDAVRLRIRFGVADGEAAGHDYDGEIERGVALRTQRAFAGAHAAYARAIALDPSRPEAYYNDGLLNVAEADNYDTPTQLALWQLAITQFHAAADRATDSLRADAEEHARVMQRTLHQMIQLQWQSD